VRAVLDHEELLESALFAVALTSSFSFLPFLLATSERVADDDIIELPMLRQDISDYLGLTIETVSRTLTQLETPLLT
jgi:CRP-like cAMP-binding protein